MNKFDCIIPTTLKDFEVAADNLDCLLRRLPIDKIVFIGSKEVGKSVAALQNDKIKFMNENDIYPLDAVNEIMQNRAKNMYEEAKRYAGWYYQQILKFLYANYCEGEYYLTWDSDTIPLHDVDMMKSKPVFHMKTEYHAPYFDTIYRLFGLERKVELSFISEHMLFSTQIVKQMIQEIEGNKCLEGDNFAEKVLNVVGDVGYSKLAFSEFETYGTYVLHHYPEQYVLEKWISLRRGNRYFSKEQLSDDELERWLGKYYDAISFEKAHTIASAQSKIINQRWVRKIVSARMFEKSHEFLCRIRRISGKLCKTGKR